MRDGLIQRQRTLVQRIDLCRLRGVVETGGQSEISVAPGFGEDLDLGIDAAESPTGGIGQREISVHERVAGLFRTFFDRKTTVADRKIVTEFA